MQADLSKLKAKVLQTTEKSALKKQIAGVRIEADYDEYGAHFLRIVLEVRHDAKATDDQLRIYLERSKHQSAS